MFIARASLASCKDTGTAGGHSQEEVLLVSVPQHPDACPSRDVEPSNGGRSMHSTKACCFRQVSPKHSASIHEDANINPSPEPQTVHPAP